MKKPALYVGRFQPFHLGHTDALKQIFEKEDRVLIVIGSAEDDYVPENPFSAGERYQMIEAALIGQKTRFDIIPLRNIHHYSLWVKHLESLLPPFGNIYTGSPIVRTLFSASGYKVFPLKMNLKISATDIRKRAREGKPWKNLIPKSVLNLIEKWDGEKRMKEI